MSTQHIVINAATGATLLAGATEAKFDRWYDHHCFWRAPRSIEEVKPELRMAYQTADKCTHYLVEDAA